MLSLRKSSDGNLSKISVGQVSPRSITPGKRFINESETVYNNQKMFTDVGRDQNNQLRLSFPLRHKNHDGIHSKQISFSSMKTDPPQKEESNSTRHVFDHTTDKSLR